MGVAGIQFLHRDIPRHCRYDHRNSNCISTSYKYLSTALFVVIFKHSQHGRKSPSSPEKLPSSHSRSPQTLRHKAACNQSPLPSFMVVCEARNNGRVCRQQRMPCRNLMHCLEILLHLHAVGFASCMLLMANRVHPCNAWRA